MLRLLPLLPPFEPFPGRAGPRAAHRPPPDVAHLDDVRLVAFEPPRVVGVPVALRRGVKARQALLPAGGQAREWTSPGGGGGKGLGFGVRQGSGHHAAATALPWDWDWNARAACEGRRSHARWLCSRKADGPKRPHPPTHPPTCTRTHMHTYRKQARNRQWAGRALRTHL